MQPEKFMLGVNYWPGKYGVNMWESWDEDVIAKDFKGIKDLGCDIVRCFLKWDAFQPIKEHTRGNKCIEITMRNNECITPVECPEMIDACMVERFDRLLLIARENGLKLIIALMVGWMSGVLLDTTWRKNRNIWTDSFMLKWQLAFCRYFARRYSSNEEIKYWELGNEHNCFMPCPERDAAWTWLNMVTSELRLYDKNHEIASGMHSLRAIKTDNAKWLIPDNGKFFDLLTVHTYPIFTPGCNMDRKTDMRASMHSSVETLYYEGLGKKPVLCEETGNLGDSFLSEKETARFLRLKLYSLAANNSRGCLWWCYSDFDCLDMIPYRWVQMESDRLGLVDIDGNKKPVAEEFGRFKRDMAAIGGHLPETKKKAAIIVMDESINDNWMLYFNTAILCKQAGLEIDFIYAYDKFDEYKLLLCPSVEGTSNYRLNNWFRIIEHVKKGNYLYVSYNGGALTRFEQIFGAEVIERRAFEHNYYPLSPVESAKDLKDTSISYDYSPEFMVDLSITSGKVLLQRADGSPSFIEHSLGQGKTFFFSEPAEYALSRKPYAFDGDETYRIYEFIKREAGIGNDIEISGAANVEKTFHPLSESSGYLILVNYSGEDCLLSVNTVGTIDSIEPVGNASDIKIFEEDGIKKLMMPAKDAGIFKVSF
ncbi:MAG: cellulase family glycosylhydrolase [bacterium]